MSAVAAVVSENGAVLLSDGLTVRIPDNFTEHPDLKLSDFEIDSTDTPKIYQVNDRVGVSWVGTMIPEIQSQIEGCSDTPEGVANWLSDKLKNYHSGQEHLLGRPEHNITVGVTGYDNGIPWGYNVRSKSNPPFSVRGYKLCQNGIDTMCSIPFVDQKDTPFDLLLEEHYKTAKTAEEMSINAFTEMIQYYAKNDRAVGGQIFSFTLRP